MATEYRISVDDYIQAGLLNGEMTARSKRIHLYIDIALVVLGALAFYFEQGIIGGALIGAAVGGNLLPYILRNYVSPWLLKRHYDKYPQMKKPVEITLDELGIRMESEDGSGILKWQDINRWRENKLLILVYLAPKIYHLIPKRIVNDGFPLQKLEEKLLDHVGVAT